MRRLSKFALLAAFAVTLLALPMFISSAGPGATVSVIVELRDDPAAVHKAKIEKSGGVVSPEQLQAYRNELADSQDQFLAARASSGISYHLQTVNVSGADGLVAGNVKFRYTLVYNGLALNVPASAVPAIKSMGQVKGVHRCHHGAFIDGGCGRRRCRRPGRRCGSATAAIWRWNWSRTLDSSHSRDAIHGKSTYQICNSQAGQSEVMKRGTLGQVEIIWPSLTIERLQRRLSKTRPQGEFQ
jgi:hypothetical protein